MQKKPAVNQLSTNTDNQLSINTNAPKKRNNKGWFKKGQSPKSPGHPRGKKNTATILKNLLTEFGEFKAPNKYLKPITDDYPELKKKKFTLRELVFLNLYIQASKGDPFAIQFITERTEGKIKESIEQHGTLTITRKIIDTREQVEPSPVRLLANDE